MLEKLIRKKTDGLFRGGLKEQIFLRAGLDRAASMKKIDTLFVGSSYAMYGIISSRWENALNLGGSSQDLYFAKKIVEQICTPIERVIVVCGYYSPYTDLSMEKNERKRLVGSVYWPILGDSHNWDSPQNITHWHKQYRYPRILRQYCEQKAYEYFYKTNAWYDSVVKRKGNFDRLSAEEKVQKAKERTRLHNKNIKYKETYLENISLIKDLKEYVEKKGTKLFIVVPPFSSLYLEGIDKQYKEDLYKFCVETNTLDGYIDCNESLNYGDELFIDADHLNDAGAVKFTADLKTLI